MSCIYFNESDIEYLSDEINEMYHRFVKIQLFIGGIVLITTLTNMSILSNIKAKLVEIKNIASPPLYKITS